MYVKFKKEIIEFSDELSQKLNLKAGKNIFLFRLKGTNTFGFMLAHKEQAKAMSCVTVRRSVNGRFYINPTDPSAAYISVAMRIKSKKIKVREEPLKETRMYIFEK